MSVQQTANAKNRAATLQRRHGTEFFATTRARLAKPRNLADYGEVYFSDVSEDDIRVYGFKDSGARDKFIRDNEGQGAAAIEIL